MHCLINLLTVVELKYKMLERIDSIVSPEVTSPDTAGSEGEHVETAQSDSDSQAIKRYLFCHIHSNRVKHLTLPLLSKSILYERFLSDLLIFSFHIMHIEYLKIKINISIIINKNH